MALKKNKTKNNYLKIGLLLLIPILIIVVFFKNRTKKSSADANVDVVDSTGGASGGFIGTIDEITDNQFNMVECMIKCKQILPNLPFGNQIHNICKTKCEAEQTAITLTGI
ncbi:hypothetical protein [Sediminibacter sp. Hel_I_10]|uniref:hypothetical protein n=1 Tax=Sediminibacter sp. Hel_I_10 TaxID=1392490 RepID=UPI00047A254F|nr:hypothetical protein [Sediminibacter sp. Hel_I_10]